MNVENARKDFQIALDKYSDLAIALVLVLIPVVLLTATIQDLSPLHRIIGFIIVPVSIIGHFILRFVHR